MARNDWELVDEDEVIEVEEDEEDEELDEGEERRVCGDRVLTEGDRQRWYADDTSDPEELTGFLRW